MKNQKRLRRSNLTRRHNLYGYLFVAPWIVGFVMLFAYPFTQAVRFSLNEISLTAAGDAGYQLLDVGWKKYQELFMNHPTFRQTLLSSLSELLINLPLVVMFALFAAVLINQRFRGRTLVRAIFFLPVILGTGVAALLQDATWTDAILTGSENASSVVGEMQGSDFLANYLTQIAGVFQVDMIDAVVEMAGSIRTVIQNAGVQILIFLAGLQSIPSSMYEASRIEGATAWESFWKITFPMLSPIILVNIIYTVVDTFTHANNQMMQMIHVTAFGGKADLSSSTAMAMVYFAAIAVLLAVVMAICTRIFRDNR